MGLDMYLKGHKFFWTNWEDPSKNRTEDGFKLQRLEVELGYWRKHPNLHGYIVNTFAAGVDDCQEISLTIEQLDRIIDAVKLGHLPNTRGFFFGESPSTDDERAWFKQAEEDCKILTDAIAWLATEEAGVTRDVIYQASW